MAEETLEREASSGVPFAKILSSEGLVDERDLVAAIADQAGLPFWDPQIDMISPMVEGLIPATLALKLRALAIRVDGEVLLVAMENPADVTAIEAIEQEIAWTVRPMMVSRNDLQRALGDMYSRELEAEALLPLDGGVADLHINTLLTRMIELGASDLHLSAGLRPCVRVDGAISPLEEYEPLNASEVRSLVYGILTDRQREKFEANLELDTAHAVPNVGRFRVNVFLQRDSVGAVLRAIPYKIVPLEQLGIPAGASDLARLPRGLVLVTGPTGSGKSTTLASMVDMINATRPLHIMTVEDPIEFLHQSKRAIVNQREVGDDTHSFADALKHVLRQDPDVILVGEMRDLETIQAALTAAETGHLVFGTLHTQDAPQSIDRIIDVFPSHQQQQIRVQLASALQGVVTQQLLPRHRTSGRVPACEILVATAAVRNLIREGKTHQIYSAMQSGARLGMITMDQHLAELVRSGLVSMEAALERCHNEADLRRLAVAV